MKIVIRIKILLNHKYLKCNIVKYNKIKKIKKKKKHYYKRGVRKFLNKI